MPRKSYGKYKHKGLFASRVYRRSAPAAPGVNQTRESAIAITVKYKAGSGRGSTLSYDQYEDFLKKAIRPWFKNGLKSSFKIVKDYDKGLVTYAVWPEDYEAYGKRLFSDPDDDGLHPVLVKGEEKLVSAKILKVEKCYVYYPYIYN